MLKVHLNFAAKYPIDLGCLLERNDSCCSYYALCKQGPKVGHVFQYRKITGKIHSF